MIKPLPGYVLIEPIKEENKSTGGVYLPDSSKDKPMKGKVIACGDSTYDLENGMDCPVKKGDICFYKKWVNQEVQHEGKEYLLIHFNELLAVEE